MPEIRCSICGNPADREEAMGVLSAVADAMQMPVSEVEGNAEIVYTCNVCVTRSKTYAGQAESN